jgi:hypothetical protein
LVTESFIAFLQVGDGDILYVTKDGKTRRPLPEDSRLVANQTTSLCQPDAANDFRTSVLKKNEKFPELVILSSDGYANSFRSDEDYLMIGGDYLEMLRTSGSDHVAKDLNDILMEASTKGSGDDITVGLLKRVSEDKEEIKLSHDSESVNFVARPARTEIASQAQNQGTAGVELLRHRIRWLGVGVFISVVLSLSSLFVAMSKQKPSLPPARETATDVPPPQTPVAGAPAVSAQGTDTAPASTGFIIRFGSGSDALPLYLQVPITTEQAGLDPGVFGENLAVVKQGENGLEVVNKSKTDWVVDMERGKKRVKPQHAVRLVGGMHIHFSGAPQTSAEIEQQ